MANYVLENDVLRAEFRDQSAELISLKKKENDQEYLWNGGKEFWGWSSPVLFPLVGTLKDNSYTYKGKKYIMEKHGFARRTVFHLDLYTKDELRMSMEDTEKTFEMYPFHFRLELGFKLEKNTLKASWKVINKDTSEMYFSIGGHPAIRCTMPKYDGYMGFEGEKETYDYLMVDPVKGGIGTKIFKFPVENGYHKITKGMFDHDALIFTGAEPKTAFLAGADKKPVIKMHTNAPLLAFWSPVEDAPFICFEPWYGMGDAGDFTGSLEERLYEQRLEGNGVFEDSYVLEVME